MLCPVYSLNNKTGEQGLILRIKLALLAKLAFLLIEPEQRLQPYPPTARYSFLPNFLQKSSNSQKYFYLPFCFHERFEVVNVLRKNYQLRIEKIPDIPAVHLAGGHSH